MSEETSPFKYLLAGGFGGICTVLTGHPLDTIKVRLQTMPGMYKGTFDAIRKIVVKEGPQSLYKGMSAPLVTVVPIFSISFFGFGVGKRIVAEPGQENLSGLQVFLAGMFSGAWTAMITIPAERIKCLLQLQGDGPKKYKGFTDCAKQLFKEGGIRNFYVGGCATLLRDVPATGLYFFSYDRLLRLLTMHSADVTWQPLVAGGSAGVIMWLYAMPADVMKSRLQTSPPGTYPRGMRSVFPALLKEQGVLGLYQGISPVMIRAFPANAACFLGLEVALDFLNKHVPWL